MLALRTALITLVFCAFATSAQGALIITAREVGADVIFETAPGGSLNTEAWTAQMDGSADFSRVHPSLGSALVGPTPATMNNAQRYLDPQNFTGPSDFGMGGLTPSSSGSGDLAGLVSFTEEILVVPFGYQSGDPLSGSATYLGEDFASLGVDLGSYTWSWGSNSTSDSLTLNIIPEPSTALLMSLGLVGLAARRRRP